MKDGEKEIEELSAKVAAARAAQEARAEARRNALQAEALRRELADLEALEKAESEHGADRIAIVEHPDGIVIVKRPALVNAKIFHDKAKFTLEAKDKFGRPCVVYPSDYAKRAADDAGLISAVADAAAHLAGFGRAELQKKSES